MISGLLKLMSRLGFAGHRTDSKLSFKTYFIIDDSPDSRKVRCARSQPVPIPLPR